MITSLEVGGGAGGGGESEKLEKAGGRMVQGQVFLNGAAGTFPISFFHGLKNSNLSILIPFKVV